MDLDTKALPGDEALLYWLWLSFRPGLREEHARELVSSMGDVRRAFMGTREEYVACGINNKKILAALGDKSLTGAVETMGTCQRLGIRMLCYDDRRYPQRLRHIVDPPLVLYYRGIFPDFDREPAIAVVGTRKATVYGCHQARQLGFQIARCGGLVVSGMAAGIDLTAVCGALEGADRAVGVLGCGVDVVYPAVSRQARKDMERCGCLISEQPPGTKPDKWIFPKRNRLLSGLCCGVLVVQAPERSGALITARYALEQGRDVFAVPGSVEQAENAGCNGLIASGATPVRCGWDVMAEYEELFPRKVHHWTAGAVVSSRTESPVQRSAEEESTLLSRELQTEKPREESAKAAGAGAEPVEKEYKPIDKGGQKPYIVGEDEKKSSVPGGLSPEQRQVWELLSQEPCHVDELIAQSGLGAAQVLRVLTMLEIQGHAKRHPGKFYTLPR